VSMSDASVRLHSRFAPSALKRVLNCPMSVILAEARTVPEPSPSFYAAEGTVAHTMAENMLRGETAFRLDDVVTVPPHSILVDDDMFVAAYTFADYVKQLASDSDSTLWTEQVVRLDDYVGNDAQCYGHLDAAVHDPSRDTLHITDFKYGRGIVVEVENNPQLLAYALGAVSSLLDPYWRQRLAEIQLHVVQPRLGDAGLKTWTLTLEDLETWARETLRPVVRSLVDLTIPDDTPLEPGPWCQFCPVRVECPALHARGTELAKMAFAQNANALPLLSNDDLGRILTQADMVAPWLEDVRTLALDRLKLGADIPGWKMVAKRGHRVWTQDETETLERITRDIPGVSVGDLMQTKLRSPAQIEKVIPVSASGRFRQLWRMESSGVTLAPKDDPRRAVPLDAALAFDKPPSSHA
jgi:hypothetical protein